jgi:hypothetical protein
LDIGVLGDISILYHKEHPPKVWHLLPGTPCISLLHQTICKGKNVPRAGFEVLVVATMKSTVFWVVTWKGLVTDPMFQRTISPPSGLRSEARSRQQAE